MQIRQSLQGPVLCPTHPSKALGVYAVPHVVFLRHLAGQLDLDSFEAQGSTGRAGQLTLLLPTLPSNFLYVRAIPYGSRKGFVLELDIDGFQSLALAGGTRSGTVLLPILLPAIGLAMHTIEHVRGLCDGLGGIDDISLFFKDLGFVEFELILVERDLDLLAGLVF